MEPNLRNDEAVEWAWLILSGELAAVLGLGKIPGASQ